MFGKRREDTYIEMLPENVKAGDYWKVLDRDSGEPITANEPTNLTKSVWMVAAPMSYGFAIATLIRHTVREGANGRISVRPNDGSSNSILITGHKGETYHGYIEDGEWMSV